MDYFLGPVSLILIMILLVGATIKINELMSGKIMDFLLNKRLLFNIALIIAIVSSIFFILFSTSPWIDLLGFVYFIGFLFLLVKYTPDLVLHLKKIHLSNLEDAEEQEFEKT
jgi:hypothetical protein